MYRVVNNYLIVGAREGAKERGPLTKRLLLVVQHCCLAGIPSLAMELMSKHANQLGIGIFKAKLGALTYWMSRNTDLFIIKMEQEYQKL